jgi:hypothetical protein
MTRFLVGCAVALLCSAVIAGSVLSRSPSGRFVPYAPDAPLALDTATGQMCWAGIGSGVAFPNLGGPLPSCARLSSGTGGGAGDDAADRWSTPRAQPREYRAGPAGEHAVRVCHRLRRVYQPAAVP